MKAPYFILVFLLVCGCGGGTTQEERGNDSREKQIQDAKQHCKKIEGYCNSYRKIHSSFPESLNDLLVQPNGMTIKEWRGPFAKPEDLSELDPWGNPYLYKVTNAGVEVLSYGPDQAIDTSDDIRN